MDLPSSLSRDISPPRLLKRRKTSEPITQSNDPDPVPNIGPTLAAVEAGKAKIDDHLVYFTKHLAIASQVTMPDVPRITINSFAALYESNQHEHGHHFVVHQHNHPKAGVHYDLRLQFSSTSSISFAVPKGLPGNPNSRSIGRMAIETRVHCLWNHLIESASEKTGSLLIWDTGTYEVLPRRKEGERGRGRIPSPQTTDDERDAPGQDIDVSNSKAGVENKRYENEKLISSFQTRYIRLRLHGTRLPKDYTVILRLPSNEIVKRPTVRRKSRQKGRRISQQGDHETESDSAVDAEVQAQDQELDVALDTDSEEDFQTRSANAYPGSTNTIGSVHQRHWFLQLDRQNSGFDLDKSHLPGGKKQWKRGSGGRGFEAFIVRGRDYERSVVTGRLSREVESDEGLEGYVGRGGWTGVEH